MARLVFVLILGLASGRTASAQERGADTAGDAPSIAQGSGEEGEGAGAPETARDPRDEVERQLESLRLERDAQAIAGPALEHAARALLQVDDRRAVGDAPGAERALDIARAALVLARRQLDRAREVQALEAARRLAENAAARARAAAEALRLARHRWDERAAGPSDDGPALPTEVRSPADAEGRE